MERNKMIALIAAVIAAVLMAIAGKSCVKDAAEKNTAVQRPTIIVSPQIVQGENSWTPPQNTAPSAAPPVLTESETPVGAPQGETTSKSKLDELWEK